MQDHPNPVVEPNVAALLAEAKIVVESEPIVAVSLPPVEAQRVQRRVDRFHSPFCFTFAPDEVSLVCREVEWEQLGRGLRANRVERGYRMITLEVVLDLSVVGYLGVVTERLALAGIPVSVVSTFHRDHLLVHSEHVDAARRVLERMIEDYQAVAPQPDAWSHA